MPEMSPLGPSLRQEDYIGSDLSESDGASEGAESLQRTCSGAARMSDWDQAYLKALYVTDQKSTLQRALIANEMVREIVH